MRRLLCCLAVSLLPALAAASVRLEFSHPGFLVIDGAYHAFDLPRPGGVAETAKLHPRGSDGFFMQAELAVGDCDPGDGSAGTLPPGAAALGHAQAFDPLAARRFSLRRRGEETQLTLAICDGVAVLFASTPSGTTTCGAALPLPFRRGQCPGLDAADPGYVFFNAFEG
jgi:putative intracellular protease/amidase